jgi:hypothetical protein
VVAVRCKIADCSLKAVKGSRYKLEKAFFAFSVQRNNVFFLNMLWLYGPAVYSKIREIPEPVLHRIAPLLKNGSF